MATAATIFELDMQRVFSNTGGGGIAWGGTGQTGTITGNQTGGSGTGSSYSSGGSGQAQGSGSNDPYAGITVVYNPVTSRIDTFDPTLLQSVMTPDGTPILLVGEELVLTLSPSPKIVQGEELVLTLSPLPKIVQGEELVLVLSPLPKVVQGEELILYLSPSPKIVKGEELVLHLSPAPGGVHGTIQGHDKLGALQTIEFRIASDASDILSGRGILDGRAGNDGITGSGGADTLLGGTGNDWLDGGAGADLMDGGEGWDVVSYQSATSGLTVDLTSNANSGAASGDKILHVEVLQGTNHNDLLTGLDRGGGSGVQLYGEGGDDGLTGKAGGDALFGGAGNDWLDGGPGGDILDGGAGWDVLSYQSATSGVVVDLTGNANGGAATGDVISNIEVLQGSNFADTLTSLDRGGGSGAQLYGEGGHDTLLGKAGGDYLFGGAGNDLLDSGFGGDVLNGGAGADTFRFSSSLGAGNVDTVQDFSGAEGDRIVLSRSVFAAAGYDALAGSAFTLGAAASTAAHRIVYNQSTGDLFYDADGVGGVAAIKFAVIATHAQLSAASFQIL
ncbi:calcium-binding protein [Microvirga sp. RSM25]|uniref:calcium-binding protein n=1 Tax=Microvirga sp. RSM25 TaxID=3273802 RepID=UPI003850638C